MNPNSSIEIFQDVSFEYPREHAPYLRKCLTSATIPPWRIDSAREEEVKRISSDDVEVFAFARESLNGIPPSYLSLWNTDTVRWTVPNVVPIEFGTRLTVHQYNELIGDFLGLILQPVLNSLKISYCVSSRTITLTDMMSDQAYRALNSFLGIGQPCSDVLHPSDEKRLCEFIWQIHEQEERFDVDLFCRWLTEAENWPLTYASVVASRIDEGLTLLSVRKS